MTERDKCILMYSHTTIRLPLIFTLKVVANNDLSSSPMYFKCVLVKLNFNSICRVLYPKFRTISYFYLFGYMFFGVKYHINAFRGATKSDNCNEN